jgi:cytochrome c
MRKLLLAGFSASGLLMLAACGGGGDEAAPAQSAQAPAAAPTPAPAPAPAPAATAAAPAAAGAAATPGAAPAPGERGAAGAVALAGLTGDAASGQRIFRQCQTCHVVEPGVNKVGPSLAGIVGRPAGTVPGFRYSPANKNSGLVWSEPVLFEYLEAPQKYIPGTYMAYAGLKQPQQRADVIAYLKTAS